MGGNLIIFNKDHAVRSKVLAAKLTASLQLLYTAGGNQARLNARTEFEKGGVKLVMYITV